MQMDILIYSALVSMLKYLIFFSCLAAEKVGLINHGSMNSKLDETS